MENTSIIKSNQSIWSNETTLAQGLDHAVNSGVLPPEHKLGLLQHFKDFGVDVEKVLLFPVTAFKTSKD